MPDAGRGTLQSFSGRGGFRPNVISANQDDDDDDDFDVDDAAEKVDVAAAVSQSYDRTSDWIMQQVLKAEELFLDRVVEEVMSVPSRAMRSRHS